MPIYEYRCAACGHQQEFLQKVSDPPRTECPKCHQPSLAKMVTAAGFQLKGSGWYATDFKNKSASATPAKADAAKGDGGGESKGTGSGGESKGTDSGGETKSAASATGGGCGTGCACH
jgi:putative FmdB family regulatory protein